MTQQSAGWAHIFLAGDCPAIYPADLPRSSELVIAVDGGYRHLWRYRIKPDLLLGDFDSLDAEALSRAERDGVALQRWPVAKDYTDAELALAEINVRGEKNCRLFGALGGSRVDHLVANVWLLYMWQQRGLNLEIVHGNLRVTMINAASIELHGAKGDLVSLLPFSPQVEMVNFSGVEYPLFAETLYAGESRGVSNVMSSELAELSIGSGTLLIMHYRGKEY